MGCCVTKTPRNNANYNNNSNINFNENINLNELEQQNENELIENLNLESKFNVNHKYKNFCEYDKNSKSGKGIFETYNYVSKISLENINKKREEFWGTNVTTSVEIWNALKLLVETKDKETFLPILEILGLKIIKNSIQMSYDGFGNKFEIPIFVINDPISYNILDGKKENFNKIELEIKFLFLNVKKILKYHTETLVKDIIIDLIELFNIDKNKNNKLIYKSMIFEENDKLGIYTDKNCLIQIFSFEKIN